MLLVAGMLPRSAGAIDQLKAEEEISDLLADQVRAEKAEESKDEESAATRRWAIIPQVGYGPETGALGGLKYTHRNIFDSGVTFDVDGAYAVNGQTGAGVVIGVPRLKAGNLLLLLQADYGLDPQRDFFGLGNNDLGPEPISTNEFQDIAGELTAGWRPFESLSLNVSVGLRQVEIRNGRRLSECQNVMQPGTMIQPCPFTPELFPDLVGINGGVVNPIGVSIVWNNRDDLVRPTRGWRLLFKFMHATSLGDFSFERYIADASYLRTFFDQRVVAGVRLNGEYVAGASGDVPYWELSELGGRNTLRGFFPYRFLGRSRLLINTEIRGQVVAFDFFDIWHIQIDGVVFADAGRVFLNDDDLDSQFHVDEDIVGRVFSDLRYDYGFGVRFAIAQAMVARIDVGFSEEETGLLYLSFGHTF